MGIIINYIILNTSFRLLINVDWELIILLIRPTTLLILTLITLLFAHRTPLSSQIK